MAWYNSSWLYRKKITIDNTKVSANETDFPVLILLSSDADIAAEAQADGDDILITSSDETTKLAHELVSYNNSTGELELHVKVPSLSSTVDTELYLYYGNSGAANQENASVLWSDYELVWHGNSGTDSSGNLTLTGSGGISYGGVTGTVGKATNFDGTDDYVDVGSSPITGSANRTLEFITRQVDATPIDRAMIFSLGADNTGERWSVNNDRPNLRIEIQGSGYSSSLAFSDNTWHYGAVVLNGTTLGDHTLFLDGSSESASGANTVNTAATYANIGALTDDSSLFGDGTREFEGDIDEIRLRADARSTDFLNTTHKNLTNPATFYSLGAEETEAGGGGGATFIKRNITVV